MTSPAERRGQRPPSLLLEQRSLRPGGPRGAPDDAEVVPNANVVGAVPPGTVGADAYTPGDPNGLEIIDEGPGAPWPRSTIRASPWSGYPSTWDTPLWTGGSGSSKFESLVDTAWMCLDLNASILSTMPPYVVKGDEVVDPPLWMENPDPDLYTSWEEFAKQLFWDYQTGEAFVLATAWYADGYPARFHVVPGWLVNVEMDAGARRYHIGTLDVTDEILPIRYKSTTDDAHGHGPLEVGRTRMIAAAVLARYAQTVAEGGGVPYYALTSEDDLTEKQTNDLLDQWWLSRTQRLGMPAVFSGGVKVETLQFSPKDQALVELAQFNESRLAQLLGVPPFIVGLPSGGDSMTYQNASNVFDFHWRAHLRTKAQPVMAALSQWALVRGTNAELDRDEYVRPGLTDRATAYATLHGIRDDTGLVLSAEEIRRRERFNRRRGDRLVSPALPPTSIEVPTS